MEANGSLFETLPCTERPCPDPAGRPGRRVRLPAAARVSGRRPRLGEAIVAWALEARWDVAMGEEAWVAAALNVEQNAALIRVGVGRQGGLAMLDTVSLEGGAVIGVTNAKPVTAGSVVRVTVLAGASTATPGSSSTAGSTPPPLSRACSSSVATTGAALRRASPPTWGLGQPLHPPSTAPSSNSYVIRALIDRRFRERPRHRAAIAVV